MKRVILILSLMVSILVPAGCDRRPKGVLSDSEMIQLMADLEVAEGYFLTCDQGDYDEKDRLGALQYVLDKHHLTKAEFDSTMTWYGRNIDDYQKLCYKVDEELILRQKKVVGTVIEEEAVADMWPYSRHFAMNSLSSSDNLVFSIKPSELLPGDRISWKMKFINLPDGNVMMGVEYEDGNSMYSYQPMTGQNKVALSLQTDTARRVKRVFGALRINSRGRETLWIDSVYLSRLPFDSTSYYRIYSHRKLSVPRRVVKKTEIDSIDRDDEILARIEEEQR